MTGGVERGNPAAQQTGCNHASRWLNLLNGVQQSLDLGTEQGFRCLKPHIAGRASKDRQENPADLFQKLGKGQNRQMAVALIGGNDGRQRIQRGGQLALPDDHALWLAR